MSKWLDLIAIDMVAGALDNGWEIETQIDPGNDKYSQWKKWDGKLWYSGHLYRGHPKKSGAVTYLCFDIDGRLAWRHPSLSVMKEWIRIPQFDKTVESAE